jgi:ATP/maltotriose-dependent transcriptional regulator MalT
VIRLLTSATQRESPREPRKGLNRHRLLGEENPLRLLTSGANVDILNLLRQEPSSPREIALFLGKDETDVSRRLRMMERAGIVRGSWSRKNERNVKVYSLLGFQAQVDFDPSGLTFRLMTATGTKTHSYSGMNDFEIPSTSGFIGRREELRRLASQDGLYVILGLPGIGKTTLALALRERPVMWHTIREVDSFGYILNKIAVFLARFGFNDALDYVKSGGDEDRIKIELIGKGLDRIRAVAIFDDYHKNRDDRMEILLDHLWKKCDRVKTVILSRSRPRFYSLGPRTNEIWLQGFSLEETREFLSTKGVEAGGAGVEKLWSKLSGHPLSLMLFCSLPTDKSPGSSIDEVTREAITDYLARELYSGLASEERILLTSLSIFRAPATPRALSEIFRLKNTRYLLDNLELKMLVTRQQDKFAIHELLRSAFYRFLDDPKRVHLGVARYYIGLGTVEDTLEAIFHFVRAGDTKAVTELLRGEIEHETHRFVEKGYAIPLLSTLEPLGENLSSEDRFYLLCLRGKARSRAGEWTSARKELLEALQIAEMMREKSLVAHATKCLAEHYYWKGNLDETEGLLLKCAEMYADLGIRDCLQAVYSQLARLSFSMGRHDKAKRFAGIAQDIKSEASASH